MALIERQISVNFSYGGDGGNLTNLSFAGFRVSAQIKIAGSMPQSAVIKIFGLSLSHMNALSKVPSLPATYGQNIVTVTAGDAINGMSVVYSGNAILVWPMMEAMPEVYLRVECQGGTFEAVKPVEASSYTGNTDVATVAGDIAKKMGATLENNGVDLKIASPYFWGTARQQMMQLGKTTRIGWIQENKTLAIWPQEGARTKAGTVIVNKDTGMVGYPLAVTGGIIVRTLFNRAIKYASIMEVKSDITMANGKWVITNIELDLNAQFPGGGWFATLYGAKYGGN